MNWDAIGAAGEIISAVAVVLSLIYLARQISMSNALARAEAFREPNNNLNLLNTTFGRDKDFQKLMGRIAKDNLSRSEVDEEDRGSLDYYFFSILNIYEQLSREVREGILDEDALDFGGRGLFRLSFFRTSWPLYRDYLGSKYVEEFEQIHDLDPTLKAEW